MRVGVIGCGNISDAYFGADSIFDEFKIVACADWDAERAAAKAERFGLRAHADADALLADPEIEVALNLTTPESHFAISRAALAAGKHVYCEKPLAVTLEEGRELARLAGERGLRIGCAPDTVLGAGTQTARRLIDEGVIGDPVAAEAFMLCPGHEFWHPDPEFYYQPGGGPLMDMGPYYLTALATLLGPAAAVAGMAATPRSTREIGSGPKQGQRFAVETRTHISGTLRYSSGAIATVIMSFDAWAHTLPHIEIHGTAGSLVAPDPNQFEGEIKLCRAGTFEWESIPASPAGPRNCRGLGLADMCAAIREGRPHRADGDLALHTLEQMTGLLDSAESERFISLSTQCPRPEPMPA